MWPSRVVAQQFFKTLVAYQQAERCAEYGVGNRLNKGPRNVVVCWSLTRFRIAVPKISLGTTFEL